MPKKLDLVGCKIGHLTVIEETDERENNYCLWLCRCDCGNTIKVSSRTLIRGRNLSCGCIPKKYPNRRGHFAEDLTGQRFGRLVILERTDNRNGRVCWLCQCDCGKTCKVMSAQLKSGKTRSCGCLREESQHTMKDLSGKHFGRLTALYPTLKRDYKGSVYWHCRCDCGNELDVTEDSLGYGNYVSCGCKKKEIQERIGETLTFVDGTCIEWLKNRKNRSDNTSGFRGVFRRPDNRYRVGIGFKGKKFHLGVYSTFEEAVQVRLSAEQFIHEEYVQRYTEWEKEAKEASSRNDLHWARRNPLIFEVCKPERGVLQIETNEGVHYLYYDSPLYEKVVSRPNRNIG